MLLRLKVQHIEDVEFEVEFPLYFVTIYDDEEDKFTERTYACIEHNDNGFITTEITYELYERDDHYESYNISRNTTQELSGYEMAKLARWLTDNEHKSDVEEFGQELMEALEFLYDIGGI
jgi:hypothetical protein